MAVRIRVALEPVSSKSFFVFMILIPKASGFDSGEVRILCDRSISISDLGGSLSVHVAIVTDYVGAGIGPLFLACLRLLSGSIIRRVNSRPQSRS